MIKSLEINNFRCFNSTKANNFVRINLLGGRNNAGKTTLLEALFLMCEPSGQAITQLIRFRRTPKYLSSIENPWSNFFFQQHNNEDILFKFTFDEENYTNKITMNYEDVEDEIIREKQNKDETDDEIFVLGTPLKNYKSVFSIQSFVNEELINKFSLEATSLRVLPIGESHIFVKPHFIPASFKRSQEELTYLFDKIKLEGGKDKLLNAFRIVDGSIEEIDSFHLENTYLALKRKNEGFTPLSLFGDALNKIADFILTIVNNKNSILLIDEIENGIHYENQEEIWKMLFDLCHEYQVQLFATTHSGEMIEAFKNIILKYELEEHGNYFEMSRHPISEELITIEKIPIYALEGRIEKKLPIRGEESNKRGGILL